MTKSPKLRTYLHHILISILLTERICSEASGRLTIANCLTSLYLTLEVPLEFLNENFTGCAALGTLFISRDVSILASRFAHSKSYPLNRPHPKIVIPIRVMSPAYCVGSTQQRGGQRVCQGQLPIVSRSIAYLVRAKRFRSRNTKIWTLAKTGKRSRCYGNRV
jgi:hypothetical protein